MPSRNSLYAALFCLGVLAQVAQAQLAREFLVVFYGNEVSLGAFFSSWLFWVAGGSLAVAMLRRRLRDQRGPLVAILALLPWLLALQIILVRTARTLMETPSAELLGLGDLFAATFVITLPTGVALGAAFPLACRLLAGTAGERAVSLTSRLYVFDALGAFAGGLLFTFVMIDWLGVWPSLGLSALIAAGAAFWVGGADRRLQWLAGITAFSGLIVLTPPVAGWLHRSAEALRFHAIQPGLQLVDTVDTRYGHLAVARLGTQYSVLQDGRIATTFPDPEPIAQQAAFFQAEASAPRRILLLGGAAAGELPAELLRYPVDRLDLVVDDRRAFDTVLRYLPATARAAFGDPRVRIFFLDGRRFVNELPATDLYDLVLVLGVDPSSAHENRYFTRELYASVRRAMGPRGVLCTAVSSASNYLGREVQSYGAAVLRTLEEGIGEVIVAPGDQQLLCASPAKGQVSDDAEVLRKRYEAIPLEPRTFPAQGFSLLLEPERVAFVRKSLEAAGGALNTDLRPITYYFNMMLWGKFTASHFVELLQGLGRMGPWPYLIPLGVLVALLLLRQGLEGTEREQRRRTSGTLALGVLGFIAMALQLELIFSYQAQVGFAFGRIALLNGLFMTGLAIGAGLLGQRLAARRRPGLAFAAVLALVAGGCLLLPGLIAHLAQWGGVAPEAGYLALITAAGLLTGAGFPLGLHQAHLGHADAMRSSGVAAGIDNLGGALGALVTGALMVPILGVAGASRVLAASALLALVPLLLAEPAGPAPSALRARGFRSFPVVRLSWALVYLTGSIFALTWVLRATAPGPQVRFGQERPGGGQRIGRARGQGQAGAALSGQRGGLGPRAHRLARLYARGGGGARLCRTAQPAGLRGRARGAQGGSLHRLSRDAGLYLRHRNLARGARRQGSLGGAPQPGPGRCDDRRDDLQPGGA